MFISRTHAMAVLISYPIETIDKNHRIFSQTNLYLLQTQIDSEIKWNEML